MTNIIQMNQKIKQPNDDVILRLEELLHLAKKGELQVLVGSYLTDDSTMHGFMAGEYKDRCVNVIGMLEDLKYDLLKIRNGED